MPDNLPQPVFRTNVTLRAMCLAVVSTTLFFCGCQQNAGESTNEVPVAIDAPLRLFEYRRPAMGVELVIQAWCQDRETANKAIVAADARVEELEQVLSNYRDDSEVSLLGDSLSKGSVAVSDDLWRVLKQAEQGWLCSDQVFDVTIGPLTDLWRDARKNGRLPTADQMNEARQQVGFGKLTLEEAARSISSNGQQVRFDFGALGKGDAADQALIVLKQHGIESAMVEVGGDMSIGEAPPGRSGWRIAVAALEPNTKPTHFIEVSNCGVATSGDTHQFVEVDGVRYSHIVDPKTGIALQRSSLVTVVASTGASADMFASIFSLLEPAAALKLAESHQDTFVRGVQETGDGKQMTFTSDSFPKLNQLDLTSPGEQP